MVPAAKRRQRRRRSARFRLRLVGVIISVDKAFHFPGMPGIFGVLEVPQLHVLAVKVAMHWEYLCTSPSTMSKELLAEPDKSLPPSFIMQILRLCEHRCALHTLLPRTVAPPHEHHQEDKRTTECHEQDFPPRQGTAPTH